MHSSPCMDRHAPKGQTILGVEYCLFVLGLTRASLQVNRMPHTFFVGLSVYLACG